MDLPKDFRPLPKDDPEDVIFDSKYGLRTIELSRPQKLNALSASMVRKIVPRLQEWEKSDMANVVVVKGAGPKGKGSKALCAGGDVTALAKTNKSSPQGWVESAKYFALEYQLDHYISTYQKPYVAFMDGITMGGGVGLSIHAPFRIATERTMFAMPETTIGFFPDVGASFFLPRMNGEVGTYLALTSERLTGANVFYSGIATHYLHSTSLAALEERLGELRFRDYDSLEMRLRRINDTIEEFATGLPHDEPIQIAGDVRRAIDRCFRHDTVGEIMQSLEKEVGEETLLSLDKEAKAKAAAKEAAEAAAKIEAAKAAKYISAGIAKADADWAKWMAKRAAKGLPELPRIDRLAKRTPEEADAHWAKWMAQRAADGLPELTRYNKSAKATTDEGSERDTPAQIAKADADWARWMAKRAARGQPELPRFDKSVKRTPEEADAARAASMAERAALGLPELTRFKKSAEPTTDEVSAELEAPVQPPVEPEPPVEATPTQRWAYRTLKTMRKRSPTSVHVALRQMRASGKWSIADTFRREHAIATKFM